MEHVLDPTSMRAKRLREFPVVIVNVDLSIATTGKPECKGWAPESSTRTRGTASNRRFGRKVWRDFIWALYRVSRVSYPDKVSFSCRLRALSFFWWGYRGFEKKFKKQDHRNNIHHQPLIPHHFSPHANFFLTTLKPLLLPSWQSDGL